MLARCLQTASSCASKMQTSPQELSWRNHPSRHHSRGIRDPVLHSRQPSWPQAAAQLLFAAAFRPTWSLSTNTLAPHHIFSCTVVAQMFRSLVVRVYRHTLTSMHLHGSRLKRIFRVSPQNTSSSARHVIHLAEPDTPHEHCFLTFFPQPVFYSNILNNPAKIHGHSSVVP